MLFWAVVVLLWCQLELACSLSKQQGMNFCVNVKFWGYKRCCAAGLACTNLYRKSYSLVDVPNLGHAALAIQAAVRSRTVIECAVRESFKPSWLVQQ